MIVCGCRHGPRLPHALQLLHMNYTFEEFGQALLCSCLKPVTKTMECTHPGTFSQHWGAPTHRVQLFAEPQLVSKESASVWDTKIL